MSSGPPDAGVPAAHSMDSTWWAVDEAGEVAELVTGEAGAFPRRPCLAEGEAAGDAYDGAALLAIRSHAAAKALDALSDEELAGLDDRLEAATGFSGATHFVWVGEPGASPPPGYTRIPVGRRTYAVSDEPARARPEGGLASADPSDVVEILGGHARFECDDYDDPYLYRRTADGPLRAEELPAHAQRALAALQLPVRFEGQKDLDVKGLVREGFDVWGEEAPAKEGPRYGLWILVAIVIAAALKVIFSGS